MKAEFEKLLHAFTHIQNIGQDGAPREFPVFDARLYEVGGRGGKRLVVRRNRRLRRNAVPRKESLLRGDQRNLVRDMAAEQ